MPRVRRSRDPNVKLHTTRGWDAGDLLMHKDLRTTSATRTIIDLAVSRHPAAEIERCHRFSNPASTDLGSTTDRTYDGTGAWTARYSSSYESCCSTAEASPSSNVGSSG